VPRRPSIAAYAELGAPIPSAAMIWREVGDRVFTRQYRFFRRRALRRPPEDAFERALAQLRGDLD